MGRKEAVLQFKAIQRLRVSPVRNTRRQGTSVQGKQH